jgi:sulfur carrier protein ThiS
MKVALKVSSSNENCIGGCDFALVELTPELAALALRRIAVLREQKKLDPDIDETYYWAYFAEYFSPWRNLASAESEVKTASLAVADVLEDLQIEEEGTVTVPEGFRVPSSQVARVECEQMIVREDSIAFMAIPKHASFRVQTVEIPLARLEAATTAGA